jgi:hypothetical protein
LRGIVSSTMVSETFQNLTGETKTTNPWRYLLTADKLAQVLKQEETV